MKKSFIYSILLIPLVLFSCVSGEIANSKDVSQSQIFTKYYVTVDAEAGNVLYEAVFRFGGAKGTSLILSEPAEIRFNGILLKGDEKLFTGYHYCKKQSLTSKNSYEVSYKDYEGEKYINSFSLAPVGIPNFPKSFSKSSSLNLEFSGPPIGENEYIELSIIDTSGTEVLINSDEAGSQVLKINSENINNLKTGVCKFRITRVYNINQINSPSIGGIFDGRYKSKVYNSLLVN